MWTLIRLGAGEQQHFILYTLLCCLIHFVSLSSQLRTGNIVELHFDFHHFLITYEVLLLDKIGWNKCAVFQFISACTICNWTHLTSPFIQEKGCNEWSLCSFSSFYLHVQYVTELDSFYFTIHTEKRRNEWSMPIHAPSLQMTNKFREKWRDVTHIDVGSILWFLRHVFLQLHHFKLKAHQINGDAVATGKVLWHAYTNTHKHSVATLPFIADLSFLLWYFAWLKLHWISEAHQPTPNRIILLSRDIKKG